MVLTWERKTENWKITIDTLSPYFITRNFKLFVPPYAQLIRVGVLVNLNHYMHFYGQLMKTVVIASDFENFYI